MLITKNTHRKIILTLVGEKLNLEISSIRNQELSVKSIAFHGICLKCGIVFIEIDNVDTRMAAVDTIANIFAEVDDSGFSTMFHRVNCQGAIFLLNLFGSLLSVRIPCFSFILLIASWGIWKNLHSLSKTVIGMSGGQVNTPRL